MNRDDIIRMAREAHLVMYDYDHPSLERFASLVAAAEREACAMLVDENAKRCIQDSKAQMILYSNATAIRARGQA
jgi:hypothetical protein